MVSNSFLVTPPSCANLRSGWAVGPGPWGWGLLGQQKASAYSLAEAHVQRAASSALCRPVAEEARFQTWPQADWARSWDQEAGQVRPWALAGPGGRWGHVSGLKGQQRRAGGSAWAPSGLREWPAHVAGAHASHGPAALPHASTPPRAGRGAAGRHVTPSSPSPWPRAHAAPAPGRGWAGLRAAFGAGEVAAACPAANTAGAAAASDC